MEGGGRFGQETYVEGNNKVWDISRVNGAGQGQWIAQGPDGAAR